MWPFKVGKTNKLKVEKDDDRVRVMSLARVAAAGAATLILIAASIFGVVHICRHSDAFGLKKFILLNPSENVTTANIKRFLELYPDQNIFSVDLHSVRKALLKHHWIADARVTRVPPETIELYVFEKVPVAVLTAADTRGEISRYYLDKTGEPFTPIVSEIPEELPEITGFKKEWFRQGSIEASGLHGDLREAIRLMDLFEGNGVAAADRIHSIHFDKKLGYSVVMDADRKKILFGWPPYGDSFTTLGRVLAKIHEDREKVRAIDLRESEFTVVQRMTEEGQT